jgi:hypothetical protein
VERTEAGKTVLEMETPQGSMGHVKRMLLLALDKNFQAKIPIPILWEEIPTKGTNVARITHTDNALARENSSGQISLQDDIGPDDSVDMQGVLKFARDGYSRVNSFLSETAEKVLYVSYKDIREAMEVSNCTSWQLFLKMIKDSKLLNVEAIIRKIYFELENGKRVYVSNVTALESKTTYFVETDLNVPGIIFLTI